MRQTFWASVVIGAAVWSVPGHGAVSVDPVVSAQLKASLLDTFPISTAPAPTATKDVDALRAAVIAGNYSRTIPPATRKRCPVSCADAGLNSSDWYSLASGSQICQSVAAQANTTVSLELVSSGLSSSDSVANAVASLDQLQTWTALSGGVCSQTMKYAYSGDVVVGFYVGSGLSSQGVLTSVLEELSSQIQTNDSIAENLAVQLCDSTRSARYSLGVFINTNADLATVQRSVQSWSNGTCLTLEETTSAWQSITVSLPSLTTGNSMINATGSATNSTSYKLATRKPLSSRDDTCTTVQVVADDSCSTLATECGISDTDFLEYNTASDLCSTLTPGQYVCCSSGDLPDYAPSPDSDGNCYAYTVKSGDSCSYLAAEYDLTVDDIEKYNTGTWGWMGCDDLLADENICLSSGYAPMPATIANAVCGPQVNGTATAPAGTDLSKLNECPLNACCDIWGQCGITDDFCTISNSTTLAPGTAAAGENGCISNCGTTLIVSDAPAEVFSIGYFEAYDTERACMNEMIYETDVSPYTHIHFAFATLNVDYSINTTMLDSQLVDFAEMGSVKKIVSIGGWGFSTSPDTYQIFRDGVATADARQTIATNVANFLEDYNLDGVDFDWEYPGEPDIPGIPAGSTDDGTYYFILLDEVKAALPAGKTVSVTAPASYWYLQAYPIEAMAAVVDYVVLMTYDLHGQWDYGNVNADPGCSDGNCLRSHVNLTETISAMSMITKAGVPSNQIAMGIASYGRSFEMVEAGCWTDMCTYTGPDSGATPGACTNTAGYLGAWEIAEAIVGDSTAEQYWDAASFSNILVYDSVQWVGWTNGTVKSVRSGLYEDFNFLGTADWAIDLNSVGDGDNTTNTTYQCTSTFANSATVVYATATVIDSVLHCTGESMTLQAGKSVMAQIAADTTIPVGTLTGTALFTSISSALAAGCTIPSAGVTVTDCTDIPAITDVTYAKDPYYVALDAGGGNYYSDSSLGSGKIEMSILTMRVWDEDVLNILISTIAATLQGLSMNSSNVIDIYYDCDSGCNTESTSEWPSFPEADVSGVVLAIYTEQTDDTDGAVEIQDLEVRFAFDVDKGEYDCAVGAFVLDAISALSAVAGFEWLEAATDLTTVGAMGMSFNCMLEDEISVSSAVPDGGDDGSGSGGATATTASNTFTLAPNPKFPCSTTLTNSAIVEYASSTITGGSTICTGSSSTVQAGKSILAQIANDATIPVGTLTGDALFTSISSALAAGCTVATEGVTVTACGSIPKITDIIIFPTEEGDDDEMEIDYEDISDGMLDYDYASISMEVVVMSVWNQNVLNALISTVAATLQGMSINATNNLKAYSLEPYSWDDPDAPYVNYTSVPSIVLAIYSEQTLETDGAVEIQDLQIEFKIDGDAGESHCGIGAFVFDSLAVLALIPGFEFLATFAVASTFGTSLACMESELIGEN
ncbi:hypothetical protein BX600DRAFT_524945 [Xylariales sp. PMI_506]|nr:hypothetical protein BX600DRAFT_524945 [Xylariales sp. PMI_506]